MTSATAAISEHEIQVNGLSIKSMRDGSGQPLLVLHHSTGSIGWTPFHEALADHFQVIAPDLPGYGQSSLPEWARHPSDLALLLLQAIRKEGLRDISLVGLGFGGWVAAEAAVQCPESFASLALVGAAGLRPAEGEYLDQMLIDHQEYARAGFRDDETADRLLGEEVDRDVVALWQFNRVMTARVSWKPYMYDRRLPHVLSELTTPTLVIHGSADRVVPPSVGRQYASTLPNARLEILEGVGHIAELEEPERVATLVREHALQSQPSAG